MTDSILRPFANGYWTWDDNINSLAFISRDVKEAAPGSTPVTSNQKPAPKNIPSNITFNDAVDELGQAQFRRLFQRRIKPNEPHIVTVQDIKDVALYTAQRKDLSPEFINFMHTRKMDEFLRSLVVYFQYYLQVWDNLMLRREEAKRKLRQPIVTVLENVVRDDLADLRSMVAKYYAYICMGMGDAIFYYHMNNKNNVSLSDKDRHLYECVLSICPKIVWIALLRRNFTLIELEMNRLFRSPIFNIMARIKQTGHQSSPEEDRVLHGKAYTVEKKLKTRCPAVQELVFDDHNFRMLAIGELRAEPFGPRMNYLEAVYTAPEEILFQIKVGVGILGLDKSYLNPILKPKEGMGKRIHIPEFKIPVLKQVGDPYVGETLPDIPPKYRETAQTVAARTSQGKMWRRYVMGVNKVDNEIKSETTAVISTSEEFI